MLLHAARLPKVCERKVGEMVGGPDVVDDIELMAGLLHGIKITGLTRVNDPENPRYKNTTDVASGGKEKTANLIADFGQLAPPGVSSMGRPGNSSEWPG